MTEYWMVIKFGPKTPKKIKEKWRKNYYMKHYLPLVGEDWLMEKKGFKYIPTIISSVYAYGEKEVEEAKKNPIVSELMSKVDVVIKKYPDNIRIDPKTQGRGPKFFWPVEVLEIKEVKDELEMLLTKTFFSKDNPKDRMIAAEYIKRTGVSHREEQMTPEQRIDNRVSFMNAYLKELGEFLKRAYEFSKQHNVKMWFHIEGV
ncbi:MAG: hypothetical protein QW506_07870 [Thermoproteota archaeon]